MGKQGFRVWGSIFLLWAGSGIGAPTSSQVDALFAPHFWKKAPGCGVSLRHEGRPVFEKGYGGARLLRAGEPESRRILNTPDTRMRMASVTKSVLAVGLLHLREKLLGTGVDLLDRTMGDLFPRDLARTRFAVITVRQLMQHTSTLVREPPAYLIREADLTRTLKNLGVLALIPGKTPGKHYEYSNFGYMLLAHVLSTVSATPWPEYLRRHVFVPLKMTRTLVADPIPLQAVGEMAEGYAVSGSAFAYQPVDRQRRGLMGSGGLISTARDMSRFLEAVENKRLLSLSSWSQAFSPSAASIAQKDSYGLGWSVEAGNVWHTGAGYGSSTLIDVNRVRDPGCRFSVAMLCNFDWGTYPSFKLTTVAASLRKLYCAP